MEPETADEESSELIEFGRKIIEIYYPEIEYACCYLPRVFKANFIGPTGTASGAFKGPEVETSTHQKLLSQKNRTEAEINETSRNENEIIENNALTVSPVEEQPSTAPKNLEPTCTLDSVPIDHLLETQDNPSQKAPPSTEERERLKQEKMRKEQQKKEKFKKKQEQLNTETLTLTIAESIKGEDGEQKVFAMCQESFKEGFVIHGFKYNNGKHKTVKEMDPLMAQLIEEQFAGDTRPAQKNKSSKTQPKVAVPELEIDFIIFHPSKSLCIGEVKAGNDVKKAKKQLLQIEQLMRAVIKRCGAENLHINKLVFLPFEKEDTRGRNQQDNQGFLFVRENATWWTETPESCLNLLNSNILYVLIGLYVEFLNRPKSNSVISKDQEISSVRKHADLGCITEELGIGLDRHDFLNSKYCRSHQMKISLHKEISFRLNDEQSSVVNDENKILFIEGPAGSGKSLVLKYKAFELAARKESVGLVVPGRIYAKYQEELALYGDELESLMLVNISDLKDATDLSTIFDGSRHAFIDEIYSLSVTLDSDIVSAICVEDMHFWITSDTNQIYDEFSNSSARMYALTDYFENYRLLTTVLRSTPEIIRHLSSFRNDEISCGNRLHGPAVQLRIHRPYFALTTTSDFAEFCSAEIEKFLKPLLLTNSTEEIAIISFVRNDSHNILTKLKEDDRLNNCGLKFGYYTADKTVSMEWNTVISVETNRTIGLLYNDSVKYVVRSRARVNLLVLQEIDWKPCDACVRRDLSKQIDKMIVAAEEDYANVRRATCPFRNNQEVELKETLIMELFKFCMLEWPAINDKMRQLFPADDQELFNLPWSLPAIAALHVKKIFEHIQLPYEDIERLAIVGFLRKHAYSYMNHNLDFCSVDVSEFIDSRLELDTEYELRWFENPSDTELRSDKDVDRYSLAVNIVMGLNEDGRISKKKAQKCVDRIRSELIRLENGQLPELVLHAEYCDKVWKTYNESLETATATDAGKELVAFILERLESNEIWNKLKQSCQPEETEKILIQSSMSIVGRSIEAQFRCSGSLLDYHPLLICDEQRPTIPEIFSYLTRRNDSRNSCFGKIRKRIATIGGRFCCSKV